MDTASTAVPAANNRKRLLYVVIFLVVPFTPSLASLSPQIRLDLYAAMSDQPNMTLTRPTETVWQINLQAPPDNRLTIEFLTELSAMLDQVEGEWRKSGGGEDDKGKNNGAGALVITSACPKFFSNGLSPTVLGVPGFFESVFDPVMYRLLTFPLVTVAAINGHAFAGGMILAFCCDYRVITGGKAMMS